MKKIMLVICALCSFTMMQAQSIERSVISPSGAYYDQGLFSFCYTISQTAVETVSSANNIMTQGFQQPENFFTSVTEIKSPGHVIAVFPNPATDLVNIGIKSNDDGEFIINMFDMLGRQVVMESHATSNSENKISLSGLPPGTYILKVTHHGYVQAISVIKL